MDSPHAGVRRIALATILAVLCSVWAAAALHFDLPVSRLRTPVFALYLIAILPGRDVLLAMYIHVAHHRGQAEIYLRDKGIKPPAYKI